jgi:hypothetical protein
MKDILFNAIVVESTSTIIVYQLECGNYAEYNTLTGELYLV